MHECVLVTIMAFIYISKAGFPLGKFVCANKQKANVIGW